MKAGLLILPFIALLIGSVGAAISSAFPEASWISALSWAAAAALIVLWVSLDFENFKSFFNRKGAKYGASSGLVVLLGILVIIGIGVLTARPRFNKTLDLSRDKLNTLSDQSVKIVGTIGGKGKPLTMTAFVSDDQVENQLRDLLALYQARGADFEIEYVSPQTNPTKAIAAKITDPNTLVIKYGAQEKRITTFNEEKVTNALVNVLKEKTKKIYFTKGHGEGSIKGTEPEGFSTIVTELEGNKYAVEELSLLEAVKVPDDADLVVVAGPKYDFKEEELRILENYLKTGGSLLSMVDAMVPTQNLNTLLTKFGIRYQNDLLILPPNDVRAQMLGQNNAIITEFDEFNPVTKDFASQAAVAFMTRNTRSVDEVQDNPNKLKVTLAAKTADIIIKVKNVSKAADLENLTEDRWEMGSFPVIAVAAGKTQAPETAHAENKDADSKSDIATKGGGVANKETRLVAIGSADFAMNGGVQQSAESRDMFMNMTSYLLQDEDFISIRPKDPTKSTIDLTTGASQLLLLILAFIYPMFFLGSGTVYWLRRRRA